MTNKKILFCIMLLQIVFMQKAFSSTDIKCHLAHTTAEVITYIKAEKEHFRLDKDLSNDTIQVNSQHKKNCDGKYIYDVTMVGSNSSTTYEHRFQVACTINCFRLNQR